MSYKVYCHPKRNKVSIIDVNEKTNPGFLTYVNKEWFLPNVEFNNFEEAVDFVNRTFDREYICPTFRRKDNIFHKDMFRTF